MAATSEPALAGPPDLPGLSAPPHNLEAEMSVLGAILISDRTLYALVIEEGLKPEDFSRDRHKAIYEAMLGLYHENEPIDVVTVSDYLKQRGLLDDIGGGCPLQAPPAAPPPPRGRPALGLGRAPLREDRPRELAAAPAAADDLLDPDRGRRAPLRAARPCRARREGDARGRPRRQPGRLPRHPRDPQRGAAEDAAALPAGHLAHRHALGLQGPRRDHRRLPARQPDHHRGASLDGEVGAGHQH